ncbi:MAG: fructose-6-phosphate aldolase [Dorea sp.]|jgi:transaldolase|nr:fructose-6-phosphate aldolase [Dorea sp.]
MKYLLDTANLNAIRKYYEIFPISGVTSNPSIVKKEGKVDFFAHMNEIRSIIGRDKSLHIQVTALDTEGMLKDADRILNDVDKDVYIKVPVTMEGIKAIKKLKASRINVTATAIYNKMQGLLAMEAGADYIAPYYNRMENMGLDPDDIIASFAEMIALYHYPTTIVAASFKNAGQVDKAHIAGAQAATLDPSILQAALQQPYITNAVADFDTDWRTVYGDRTISEL